MNFFTGRGRILTFDKGGLCNCQTAVRKANFISALASHHVLETFFGRGGGTGFLLSLHLSFTPLSLSHLNISTFEFHTVAVSFPKTSSLLPSTGLLVLVCLEEMYIPLIIFQQMTPLTFFFTFLSDKFQTSCLLLLLYFFSLFLNNCFPTHKGGNALDLAFSHPLSATDITATSLHISDHYLLSFTISLTI